MVLESTNRQELERNSQADLSAEKIIKQNNELVEKRRSEYSELINERRSEYEALNKQHKSNSENSFYSKMKTRPLKDLHKHPRDLRDGESLNNMTNLKQIYFLDGIIDFQVMVFNYIDFTDCTFEDCKFDDNVFKCCNFSDCTFITTSFNNTTFMKCDFKRAVFKGDAEKYRPGVHNVPGSPDFNDYKNCLMNFSVKTLMKCDFSGAYFEDIVIYQSAIAYSNLTKCNFNNVHFYGIRIEQTILTSVFFNNKCSFNPYGSETNKTSMKQVLISDLDFSYVSLENIEFEALVYHESAYFKVGVHRVSTPTLPKDWVLCRTWKRQSFIIGKGVILNDINLEGLDLNNVNVEKAQFINASFKNATFKNIRGKLSDTRSDPFIKQKGESEKVYGLDACKPLSGKKTQDYFQLEYDPIDYSLFMTIDNINRKINSEFFIFLSDAAIYGKKNDDKDDDKDDDDDADEGTDSKCIKIYETKDIPENWDIVKKYFVGPSAKINGANFSNCNLSQNRKKKISFDGSVLFKVNFTNTNLKGANFKLAELNYPTGYSLSVAQYISEQYPAALPEKWHLVQVKISEADGKDITLALDYGYDLSKDRDWVALEYASVTLQSVEHKDEYKWVFMGPTAILRGYTLTYPFMIHDFKANTYKYPVVGKNQSMRMDLSEADLYNIRARFDQKPTNLILPEKYELRQLEYSVFNKNNPWYGDNYDKSKKIVYKKWFILGPGAELSNLDLSNNNLNDLNLESSNFKNTNITNCNFAGTTIGKSVFTNIYGRFAHPPVLDYPDYNPTSIISKAIKSYIIRNGYIIGPEVILRNAGLNEIDDFNGVHLESADITGVDFENSDLSNCSLRGIKGGPIRKPPIALPKNWLTFTFTKYCKILKDKPEYTPVVTTGSTPVVTTGSTPKNRCDVDPCNCCKSWPISDNRKARCYNKDTMISTGIFLVGSSVGLDYIRVEDYEFNDIIFSLVDFTNSIFIRCTFNNCTFESCKFNNFDLETSTFKNCSGTIVGTPKMLPKYWNMIDGQFKRYLIGPGVTLTHVNMMDGFYEKLNLSNATLKFCTFTRCVLKEALFINANISYCKFLNCSIKKSNFDNAHFEYSDLSISKFNDSTFINANIKYTHLYRVDLSLANVDKLKIIQGNTKPLFTKIQNIQFNKIGQIQITESGIYEIIMDETAKEKIAVIGETNQYTKILGKPDKLPKKIIHIGSYLIHLDFFIIVVVLIVSILYVYYKLIQRIRQNNMPQYNPYLSNPSYQQS
uniref:Pentapeptide repeat protein n=1 Tax=Megaviridae environmental sample TaxID=1737588 RepID=A0A5J6VKI9_9VIRU|nr:MAG: pentapeptide repeat protein [Megaviridae environmental sample]